MADLKRKIFWAFLLQLVVGGSVGIAQERAILTLPEAQQLYLSRSPEVEAERQRIEIARGAFRQAGVLPNPQLNYSQEGFPLGARNPSFFQDQEFVFWGSQKLELGGKRGHRREAARLGLKRAEAEFADRLRRRTAQLKQTFARAYFAQRRRELVRQHLRQYGEIRDIHRPDTKPETSPVFRSFGSTWRRFAFSPPSMRRRPISLRHGRNSQLSLPG